MTESVEKFASLYMWYKVQRSALHKRRTHH